MKFLYGLFIVTSIVVFLIIVIIWIILRKSNTPFSQISEREDIKISEKRITIDSQKPVGKDETSLQLTTDSDRYEPGDTVKITARVINQSDGEIVSTLIMLINVDHPFTKIAVDKVLHEYQIEISVPAHSSQVVNYFYTLPLDLSANDVFSVQATFRDTRAITQFTLIPLLQWDLTLPDRVQEGTEFIAQVRITNPQSITLKNIRATLSLPFEISAQSPLEQQIATLGSGDSKMLQWNLSALSHSEVSQFIFDVTSDNGGNISIFEGIEILGR